MSCVSNLSLPWEIFSRQAPAINEIWNSRRPDLRLFGFEDPDELNQKGEPRRKFAVSNYHAFWERYRQNPQRHYHEIILEWFLAKLYFDLEFNRAANPALSDDSTMTAFYDHFIPFVKAELGVTCDRTDFLELDSSTPVKFSRHLVFASTEKLVFKNNHEMRKFVFSFCESVRAKRRFWPSAVAPLFCAKTPDAEATEFVIDPCVYSKKQSFRVFLSSKAKPGGVPLVLSEGNQFCPPGVDRRRMQEVVWEGSTDALDRNGEPLEATFRSVFMASLICDVPRTLAAKAVKSEGDPAPNLLPPYEPSTRTKYPVIDEYVQKEILGAEARVSEAWHFPETCLLGYNVVGRRFCRNIRGYHPGGKAKIVVNYSPSPSSSSSPSSASSFDISRVERRNRRRTEQTTTFASRRSGFVPVERRSERQRRRPPSSRGNDGHVVLVLTAIHGRSRGSRRRRVPAAPQRLARTSATSGAASVGRRRRDRRRLSLFLAAGVDGQRRSRREDSVPVRSVQQVLHGSVEFATSRAFAARAATLTLLSRVWQIFRHFFGIEATSTHPLLRQTLSMRGMHEGVHAVFQLVPPQAHARRLSHANKVQRLRSKFFHRDLALQAQALLRGGVAKRPSALLRQRRGRRQWRRGAAAATAAAPGA